jgi:carbon-monoxide dehydrogenase medium subunit
MTEPLGAMKPPPFAYEDPTDVAQAVRLLAAHQPDAKVLAGGQSLVPLLNFQLARPKVVVDLNRIEALRGIVVSDGRLRIGAMARQSQVEAHPEINHLWPMLPEIIGHIAHPQIRNRGTIGGSLAHNDPAAELPAAMLALDAVMTVIGPNGSRTIAAEEFFVETLTTALAPDELLTDIAVPALAEGTGWSFREIARRQGDFALVAVVVVLTPDGDRCADARVVVTGVGDKPARIRTAERILVDRGLGDEARAAAAAAVPEAIAPGDDLHAPAWYRRKVAETLTLRACQEAVQRLGG